MDAFIWIGIIFLVIVIITALISAIMTGTMEIALQAALPAALIAGIVGAIIGVLAGVFSLFDLGLQGVVAILVLAIVGFLLLGAIAFIIVFAYNSYPNWARQVFSGILVIGMVIGLVVGLISLVVFMTQNPTSAVVEYLKFASPVTEGIGNAFTELSKFKYCFTADPRCPFFINWENPTVQSQQEQFYTKLNFAENRINNNDYLESLCSLSIMNPSFNDLEFKPDCYYGDKEENKKPLELTKLGSYAFGDRFIFQPSFDEQHTSFRCSGYIAEASGKNVYSTNLYVYLTRPISVKTSWLVYIGGGKSIGQQKSVMDFKAPYSVALTSYNDMPFNTGKKYDFSIVIKNQDERKSKFLKLNRLTLNIPEDYLIHCEGLDLVSEATLEISEKTAEELKTIYYYSQDEDKYTIPCSLMVNNAPVDSTILSPISVETYYSTISKFETKIVKKP